MMNELHEDDDVDERPLTADNPLVQELMNVVLREAQRIVKENTFQFTVEDLLEAARFWLPGEMPRFHKRKQSAWNLALRHEKAFAPADLLKQKAGVRSKGGQGLKGEYQQWLAERWKTDTELRKKYERMAAAGSSTAMAAAESSTAGEGDVGHDENEPANEPLDTADKEASKSVLKTTQRKSMRNMLKHVSNVFSSYRLYADERRKA
jgi:hypothetical protein